MADVFRLNIAKLSADQRERMIDFIAEKFCTTALYKYSGGTPFYDLELSSENFGNPSITSAFRAVSYEKNQDAANHQSNHPEPIYVEPGAAQQSQSELFVDQGGNQRNSQ